MLTGDVENVRRPLVVAGDVRFQTTHDVIAVDRGSDVFIVQEQP